MNKTSKNIAIVIFFICFTYCSVNAAQCGDIVRNDLRVLSTFQADSKICNEIQPRDSKDIEVLERMSNCEVVAAEKARDDFCTPALKETWRVLKFLFHEKSKFDTMLARGELPYKEYKRLTDIISTMQVQEVAKGQTLAHQQLDRIEAAGAAAYWATRANQRIQEGFRSLQPQNTVVIRDRWINVVDRNGNSIGRIDNGGGFNSQGSFYSNSGNYQGFVDTGGGFNSHGSVYDKNGSYVGRISPN